VGPVKNVRFPFHVLSCRHLVCGQFIRTLNTTFPTAVTRQQTAENNSMDLHAQNKTAP
jgi:hypothetical protein